jgi:carboxypeptidase Taq
MAKTTDQVATPPAFTESDERIAELLGRMHAIGDLRALAELATWDQNTTMPPGAAEVRGAQHATLQSVMHERWTDPALGRLLVELEPAVRGPEFTDADRGLVRQALREHRHATRLPTGLVEEIARVGSASFEAWRAARAASDFAVFAPWLARTAELQREVADRYGYQGCRYDALLDLYEPAITVAELDPIMDRVRDVSLALLRRIQTHGRPVDASCLEGNFPRERQMALCRSLLEFMGFDFARGQLAVSPHPFTTDFGSPYDVRVTVRPDERFLPSALMAAVHEGGHAVYEQGSSPALVRTPVAGGASMGVHESQSRLWENAIGRSLPFWRTLFPRVRRAYPRQYSEVEVETFVRALNRVRPSLIRVEADEVTYNLHIVIRYELEQRIVAGDVAVESLPRLWNAKYQEYLGIEPHNDAEGILQDVHWSGGFGYFPTYTLGNLYAAQIYAALRRDVPDVDERLARGQVAPVLHWLQRRMYVLGAVYLPRELIQRVTGEPPNPEHWAHYLTAKAEATYQL